MPLLIPVTARDHSRGPEDAQLTLVQFADFECPHCALVFPVVQDIAKELKAPEQTWGYERRAATMVGYQQASYVTFAPIVDPQTGLTYQAPNGSTATLSAANAAKTVVLRTKAWGHEGGNDYSAQLVDPKANNAPLTVSLTAPTSSVNRSRIT